ncbi:hypothetical protein MIND_00916500 [Mycena indigotica]|uniref:DUF6534 domain-containing protein n=1 Tax=Mycena indigotica TaxID=2126181 RepID=A0A8H6VWW3_9AGAR|nr:uncharacterized protein MIND_00916500 [Mycena indigotica]KAF7296852.1 hypothetical protein MIND_00916500 [Mycena indigotica]
MAGVDLLFGPMLIGVLLNILLYGVMASQMLTYYIRFPHDMRAIRFFILYLLIVETVVVIVEVGIIYEPLIMRYGTVEALTSLPKLLPADAFLIVFVATPVQLFAAWRIWVITHSYIAPIIIAAFSTVSFIGGMFLSFAVSHSSRFSDFSQFAVKASVWLVSSAMCDIVLATAMAHALLSKKTGNDKAVDGYINRIVRLSIESGSLTAAAAFMDVILTLSLPKTALNFVVDFPLSTLYTCSLLALLNARDRKPVGASTSASDAEKLQGSTMAPSETKHSLSTLPPHDPESLYPHLHAAKEHGYASFYSYDSQSPEKPRRSKKSDSASSNGSVTVPGSPVRIKLSLPPPPKRLRDRDERRGSTGSAYNYPARSQTTAVFGRSANPVGEYHGR